MQSREKQDKLTMDKMDKKITDLSSLIIQNNSDDNKISIDAIVPEAPAKDINYWRSFRELYNDPEFIKERDSEFAPGALDKPDTGSMSKFSRRKFLALLSASAAVAASGCSNYRNNGEIVPYLKKPESVTIGLPNYYASTCTGCGSACGILIKTLEGRPIKVDGNPDHPVSKGKICAIGQASVMNLYDPERLKNPVERTGKVSPKEILWGEADDAIIAQLKNASSSGKEIAIVTHTVNSPSQKKLFEDFQKAYPTAKIYSYEVYNDSTKKSAWEKCYGTKLLPVIQLEKAKVILALESDFLDTEGNKVEQSRLFAENKDAERDDFVRIYAVEGNASLTGMNADYRLILRTDAIEEFVMCLLKEFLVTRKLSAYANDAAVISKLQSYRLDDFASKHEMKKEVLDHLISDLGQNQGSSLVTAGGMLPESTHIAVNLLNEVLGNSKLYSKDITPFEVLPHSTKAEKENLISDMQSGKAGVVIHFDTNPVYNMPSDSGYAEALKNVPLVITMAEGINETCDMSNYVLPVNTMFESWGDFRTRSNFYSLQQPVIAPLYNTRQKEEILLTWIKGSKNDFNNDIYHQYMIDNWKTNVLNTAGGDSQFMKEWYAALNDGVVMMKKANASGASESVTGFKSEAFAGNNQKMTASSDMVLMLLKNSSLGDGRFANNGWLHELPNPVTKVVWDNYAAISPQTAKSMKLETNDKVNITSSGGKIELPVYIQPGMSAGVIAITTGYGRSVCGIVGKDVGVNANKLMIKNYSLSKFLYNDVKIEKTSGTYELVTTQDYYAFDEKLYKDIQYKREIIQEGTFIGYKENPDFMSEHETKYSEEEKEKLNVGSINEQYKHTGTKWGMVIDLNKCTGCNDCVAACNVENNIPIAGKDQFKKHRGMHWMRIDRYYSGTPEVPKTSFQPMLCQHCDFAPCENVCPVAATTHTPDGINAMAYNRCVGTRYCSNNCPYKVRRFNYFNFRDRFRDGVQLEESYSLMANPEVTVRSRGVMEKCTFCVQRIMQERQNAIQENRYVKGSNVKTACQEACNTNAIYFGDQNDETDAVFGLNKSKLAYSVLEEIKVKPNITYLAKLRNVYETETKEEEHN